LGRKSMVEYSGGIYHLIQRGNNREFIFECKEDKAYLLELVRKSQRIMGFECYGFVVMGNHYHMIIRRHEVPVKDIMHRINNQFSRYYNQKNKRTGHVFENRYKGLLVVDDKYLLSLLRYVHQNPVCAKICYHVKDYPWSSDLYYRDNKKQDLVSTDFILDIFSEDRIKALKAYSDFMDANKLEAKAIFEGVDFVGKGEDINNETAKEPCKIKIQRTLDELLKEVTMDHVIYEAIKSGSRKRNLSCYKKEYIDIAMKENYTMRAIGENISVSEVAIYLMCHKDL